jgi:argininosuccinate lyase
MLATEVADYLVARGMPFREAHAITGRVVRAALDQGRDLADFSLNELRIFSDRFEKGVLSRLGVMAAIDRKAQIGSTARMRVDRRIKELERILS